MDKKHKPFDLKAALSGDKFAREIDMKEPKDWKYYESFEGDYKIICVFNGSYRQYTEEGLTDSFFTNENRLVMLPKTKKLWLAVSHERLGNDPSIKGRAYNTSLAFENENQIREQFSENNWHFVEVEIEA